MEQYYNNIMNKINNFDYNSININDFSFKNIGNKAKGLISNKLIIFLIVGVVISFLFFNFISILFKTPFTIIVGLIIGYTLYKMQSKYENFVNKK